MILEAIAVILVILGALTALAILGWFIETTVKDICYYKAANASRINERLERLEKKETKLR